MQVRFLHGRLNIWGFLKWALVLTFVVVSLGFPKMLEPIQRTIATTKRYGLLAIREQLLLTSSEHLEEGNNKKPGRRRKLKKNKKRSNDSEVISGEINGTSGGLSSTRDIDQG